MFIILVADATLFDFILVSYNTLVYKYIRHTLFFAWGLHCGCIFKMTGSLLAQELSCCDCLRVKVSIGIVPCPQWYVMIYHYGRYARLRKGLRRIHSPEG